MKLTAPKGTRDILPAEIYAWQHIERTFADVCDAFGFSEIRIPTFESTEVFQRGVGGTTDVVQKEMYTFCDKGNRSISLRPEGTAGVARSFIENGMSSLPFPVKLFYNITAFRYENVQKGRYREFHQLGLEAFGSQGPQIDAEIISLI
ncbi:MAG: ATP phosphoribosyltransferase regulatory subunit, partial [Saccharofermentanales bacterium]